MLGGPGQDKAVARRVRCIPGSRASPRRPGRWFEDHTVALTLERLDGAAARAFGVAPVVTVSSRLLAGRLASQEVVGRDEHGVGDGGDGLLVAAMRHDVPMAGVRVFTQRIVSV